MDSPAPTRSDRRSFKLLGWAALPVLVLAGVVQVSGVGIDILLLAAGALVLLGLERSVGDWLGEWFGSLGAAAIFVAGALAVSWFFLADALGRSQTDRLFAEAERRGYRTAYYQRAQSTAHQGGTALAPDATTAAPAPAGDSPVVRSTTPPEQTKAPAVERAEADRPEEALDQQGNAPARRSILSWFRRDAASRPLIATEITIKASPSPVAVARRTAITAIVMAGPSPVTSGTVDFVVNGLGAGRVELNGQGIATTTFQTHIAGTYEIRARYSGSSEYESSRPAPVILTVTKK